MQPPPPMERAEWKFLFLVEYKFCGSARVLTRSTRLSTESVLEAPENSSHDRFRHLGTNFQTCMTSEGEQKEERKRRGLRA